jgi:hypothetical protein
MNKRTTEVPMLLDTLLAYTSAGTAERFAAGIVAALMKTMDMIAVSALLCNNSSKTHTPMVLADSAAKKA